MCNFNKQPSNDLKTFLPTWQKSESLPTCTAISISISSFFMPIHRLCPFTALAMLARSTSWKLPRSFREKRKEKRALSVGLAAISWVNIFRDCRKENYIEMFPCTSLSAEKKSTKDDQCMNQTLCDGEINKLSVKFVIPPELRSAAPPSRCWGCGWWCWKRRASPFPGGRLCDSWCRWWAVYGPERETGEQLCVNIFTQSDKILMYLYLWLF